MKNEPGFRGSTFTDIILNNFTFVIVCFLFITACKYFKGGYIAQQFEAERKQQQLMAEINNLKSQIAPHFLFNTLNNIYATALKASPETAALIAHLSGFLDYNLYDASREKIALTLEMEYIKHYIELEKNRYGNKVDVSINIFDEIADVQLAPLLLLPLVENCFKHGVRDSVERSWVRVDVSRDIDGISIVIESSKSEPTIQGTSNKGGLGLANVKKRLQLIYPHAHKLKVAEGPNSYLVILKIQI